MRGQNKHSVARRLFRRKKQWMQYAKRRRIRHFKALPSAVAGEVNKLRNYVAEHDPMARMKLTGSWTKGTWMEESATEEFRRTRFIATDRLGPSELNILIESQYPFTIEELQALTYMKVRLWKLPFAQVKGIILLKAGEQRKRLVKKELIKNKYR